MDDADYLARVAHQVAQYADSQIHQHPPIHEYWSNTYLRPKLNAVLGIDTIPAFYVEHILQRTQQPARILSLGAGDADLEIQLARQLLSRGLGAFTLECLELSPILIDKANQDIREAHLSAHVVMVQLDLNAWSPAESSQTYTAVIANHVLHHMVELESLFAKVSAAIGDTGVFLTADMIGRNGHMRWPETLALVNALWDTLPESLKFNHPFGETDHDFKNWDCCSMGGFEGIRSQDILPLLVDRFRFEKFLGFGGLPEVFCERVYGPNFDPNISAHARFIDSVEQLNSLLLQLGVIKPTMMFAVLSNRAQTPARVWKNLTPEFCVRDPQDLDLSRRRQKSPTLAAARQPDTVSFRQGQCNENTLRSGWSSPESWGTWMVGSEAVLEVPVPPTAKSLSALEIRLRATAFLPQRLYSRSFTFLSDGVEVATATFSQRDLVKVLTFAVANAGNGAVRLRVIAHEQASPAEDGSADTRLLGIGIADIAVC